MFEAVRTDLVSTISLKRSTQNLRLSTSSPADYPIFGGPKRNGLFMAASQSLYAVYTATQGAKRLKSSSLRFAALVELTQAPQ